MPTSRASARAICPKCGREMGCYLPTVPHDGTLFWMREHKRDGARCEGSNSIAEPIEGTIKKYGGYTIGDTL